jgi:hypothetical protein
MQSKNGQKKRNNIRYKLHWLIRKEGYKLVTPERKIYVPYNNTELSKNALRLKNEFGYGVQTFIV